MSKHTESQTENQNGGDNAADRIWTIPNIMSFFRLLLIPVIMWAYLSLKKYWIVAGLLILSGLTDVADGYIARHFNQVSNLGKILDPIADKFTEGILMILLALRYTVLWVVVGIFAFGAFLMSFWGIKAINLDHFVNAARWYGKATTVFLYTVMLTLLVWTSIPRKLANGLIIAAGLAVIGSVTGYGLFYRKHHQDYLSGK